jgi:cation:H+ antiporter
MAVGGSGGYAVLGFISMVSLVVAAEVVVQRIVRVAKYYGVSEAVIGLTVVSLGTSLPEIAAHAVASLQILLGVGNPRILSATVLGGNIGSDVVQQTLVLGLVVLLVGGFRFSYKFLLRGYVPMIGTTLLTLLLAWDRTLTRVDGMILLTFFTAYTYGLYTTRSDILQQQGTSSPSTTPRRDTAVSAVGLLVVLLAAHFLFRSVGFFVARTGLEGSLIGVVVLGVGSASPEMVTAIVGLREGAEGLSLGTLIGSNITNPLLGIGLGSLLSTYHVPTPLVYWDLPMETVTASILLMYLLTKDDIGVVLGTVAERFERHTLQARFETIEERHMGRVGAALLIVLYFVYLLVRVSYFPEDF